MDAVAGLDVLQLFVLTAVLRLHRRGHAAPNFELAWAEYARTAGMQHADNYGRAAAARAFQRLVDAGLLAAADARCAWAVPPLAALVLLACACTCKDRVLPCCLTDALQLLRRKLGRYLPRCLLCIAGAACMGPATAWAGLPEAHRLITRVSWWQSGEADGAVGVCWSGVAGG